MKQILLTFVVWLCCLGASAQTNFALNCATSASSQNGDNTAAKAVDGKNGTRWESAQTDDEWWSVDLGEARTFDMIVIRWEGAYAKSFRIVAGNNADFSDAVTVVEKENESISNLNQIYNFNEVTARYVKFVGIKRATAYGYSFYEFAIYKEQPARLASITLSSAADICRVGKSVALTVATFDQYGMPIDTEAPEYSVSPVGAGSVEGNMYTPTLQGEASITATIDEVASNSVVVLGHEGTNRAGADKVIDYNAEAEAGTIAKAFDGKENDGVCVLRGNTDNKNYTVFITLDLGKRYDLKMVSLCFEGASSAAYTIQTSADNVAWATAATVNHPDGINAWKDRITALTNNEGVRYVKFESTKAATGYGVKLYEFAVYADASDGELEKDPEVDTKTGAYHLYGVLNSSTADLFDSDNSVAYDMTAVTIPAAIVVTAQNPNAMFIVTDEQKTLLSGTKNLVVKSGNSYASENIQLVDGYDVNTLLTIDAEAVSYSRDNGYSGLQTFVAPFTASVPAGAKVYGFIDKNTEGLFFQEVVQIAAGTPYLIKGSTGVNLSATNTTLHFNIDAEEGDDATFRATYKAVTAGVIGGNVYILDDNNTFRKAAAGAAIGAFRAYVTSSGALSKMAVVLGETDGIRSIENSELRMDKQGSAPTGKANSDYFNLAGQKVNGDYKGIVIKNGKKVRL